MENEIGFAFLQIVTFRNGVPSELKTDDHCGA